VILDTGNIAQGQAGNIAHRYGRIQIKTDNHNGSGQVEVFPWLFFVDFGDKSQHEYGRNQDFIQSEFPGHLFPFGIQLKLFDRSQMSAVADSFGSGHGGDRSLAESYMGS